MDPTTALGIGQLALGGAGLFGASSAQRAQSKYMKEAAKALKVKTQGQREALAIARDYDPMAETQKAVDYAGDLAADRLGKSLADTNQRFRTAGGSPSGDTAFRVQAQGAANRVADPLRSFAAERAAQATQMRLNALTQALGAGGNVADSYLSLANASQPDFSGAIQAFSSAFGNLTRKAPGALDSKKFVLEDTRTRAAKDAEYA